MTEALAHLDFPHPWSGHEVAWSKSRGLVRLCNGADIDVTAEVTRCLAGRLQHAYPVSAYDVEVVVSGVQSAVALTAVLQCLVAAITVAEPKCRRIVYAVPEQPQDAVPKASETLHAARAAGLRYVTGADVNGVELELFVVEPDWVTRADIDLGRVPDS